MARFKVAMVHMDAEELPAWIPETMASNNIEFVFEECETRAQLASCAGDADVVWVCGGSLIVDAESLADLPRCGALIRTGSGTDNIPIDAATERGIIVANTPEAFSDGVSDHTVGLLLAVVRQNRHPGSHRAHGHLGPGGRLPKLASARTDAGADRFRPYRPPGDAQVERLRDDSAGA